jgi:hypothetical protein
MAYQPPENDAVDFTVGSYTVPANDAVDFTFDREVETFRVSSDRITLPLSLDLPLGPLNLSRMETGTALFIIGMLATLGGAAAALRNYVAGAVLGIAVVSLLLSGTIGTALTPFWALLIATVLVLIVGAMFRVMSA